MKPFIFLLLSFCTLSLHAQNTTPPDSMTWENLLSGNQCLIEYPENLVLKTPEGFQALWNRAFAKMDVPPAKPSVDFGKYHVAAIFLGWKKKGGYILEIEKISARKSGTVIHFLEKEPGASCLSAAVIDFPYLLVRIPIGEKDTYAFDHKKVVYECP